MAPSPGISHADQGRRRDPRRVRAAEDAWLARRNSLHRRLEELCGIAHTEWQARCERVQKRVTALAETVNRRRFERDLSETELAAAEPSAPPSWQESIAAALGELLAAEPPRPPAPVVVAEQQDFHPLVEDVSDDLAAEIQTGGDVFAGVRVVELLRREYPSGMLAANLLGHLGPAETGAADAQPLVGRMGIERMCESR